MAINLGDRVKETSTSTGTSTFTLAGAATGFRTFNAAVGTNNYFTYAIVHQTANEWEVGLGYLSASTTLVRGTLYSSSTGSFINFTAGTKDVFITQPAKSSSSNNALFLGGVQGSPESYSNWTSFGHFPTIGGNLATAYGASASANGASATAVGAAASAIANTTAIGANSTASGSSSTAVGDGTTASGADSLAVGRGATANTTSTTAVGRSASATGVYTTAIGQGTSASTQYATAVGYGAAVNTSNYGTAVGQYSTSTGTNSVALGGGNTSSGYESLAVGTSCTANTNYAVAIGSGSTASGYAATALGQGLVSNQSYQFKVRVRTNPGISTTYSLKYDDANNEVFADNTGGGGGVTQIVAGTGISISPAGGTGVVTINATGGGGGGWYSIEPFTSTAPAFSATVTLPSTWSAGYSGPADELWVIGENYSGWGGPSPGGPWTNSGMYPVLGQRYYLTTSFGAWSTAASPTSLNNPSSYDGFAVAFTRNVQADANTMFFSLTTGNNSFTSAYYYGGWPLVGSTRVGHAIIVSEGGDITMTATFPTGATKKDAKYDSYTNSSIFAVDYNSAALNDIASYSQPLIFFPSSRNASIFFWYTHT